MSLSFYDETFATEFYLRFPTESCFHRAREILQQNREDYSIVESKQSTDNFLKCEESMIFYSEARDDARAEQEGNYADRKTINRYMKVRIIEEENEDAKYAMKNPMHEEEKPEGIKRFEIKRKLDKLLNDVDYALLFSCNSQNSTDEVEPEILKEKFLEVFREFKYFKTIKYFSSAKYSTPIITAVTQTPSTLKEILYPMLDLYKEGKLEESMTTNSGQTHHGYYCFAKMGRLRSEEVQFSVAKHFKGFIEASKDCLRHYISHSFSKTMFTFYTYCSFQDKKALTRLNALSMLFKPYVIRLNLGKGFPLERSEARLKKEISGMLSQDETFLVQPLEQEDALLISVYSRKEKVLDFQKLCSNIQGRIQKSIDDFNNKKNKKDPIDMDMSALSGPVQQPIDGEEMSFLNLLETQQPQVPKFGLGVMEDSGIEKKGLNMEDSHIGPAGSHIKNASNSVSANVTPSVLKSIDEEDNNISRLKYEK